MSQTVAELQARLSTASDAEFAVLERALRADTRKRRNRGFKPRTKTS